MKTRLSNKRNVKVSPHQSSNYIHTYISANPKFYTFCNESAGSIYLSVYLSIHLSMTEDGKMR